MQAIGLDCGCTFQQTGNCSDRLLHGTTYNLPLTALKAAPRTYEAAVVLRDVWVAQLRQHACLQATAQGDEQLAYHNVPAN